MRNPYEVLEIKEGASEEEIKRAYRVQVKKYHPDQYQDNPLSKLAEEKLREVNEAYDYLTKNINTSTKQNTWSNSANWKSSGGTEVYTKIRGLINAGNLSLAEELLNGIDNKDAEWYYLKGVLFLKKGWYDEAQSHIRMAVNMNPNNFEYRSALNQMSASNGNYRGAAMGRGYGDNSNFCNICMSLWCADSLCECCGGDLIGCC